MDQLKQEWEYLLKWVVTDSFPWCREHLEIPAIATAVYVVMLLTLPRIMKNREPLTLWGFSLVWNFLITAFSAFAAWQVLPGLLSEWVYGKGISQEWCDLDHELNPWIFFFVYSKFPEFVDTAILMLRKKPVIFLHWYHHITTMWFCWMANAYTIGNGAVFAGMNLFVHTIMYGYYLCCTLKIFWPGWARVGITVLQIAQMIIGLTAIVHNIIKGCAGNVYQTYIHYAGLAMYSSFALLFIQFFLADIKKPKPPSASSKAGASSPTPKNQKTKKVQ